MNAGEIIGIILIALLVGVIILAIYDRLFQKQNLVKGNFPVVGRFRYFFHELRPFFRQYFGDDDAFAPRVVIDWILDVANGKSGYFAFDKFDTTMQLHDGKHQMVHAATPFNMDEVEPGFPLVGKNRKNPFQMKTYFYRSAMSLGALGFEATSAMAAACADTGAAFNTGEGGFSIHHIPRVKFNYNKKFLSYKKVPNWGKLLYKSAIGVGMRTNIEDFLGRVLIGKDYRDLYLFCPHNYVFYKINWEAPLSCFPKPKDLDEQYGNVIFQIGSGLYGLRKKRKDGVVELDWDRFKKVTSFCKMIEIKLAQGAKQTGGILKASKNTPAIAEIRGINSGIDLVSPNRFPFFPKTDNPKKDVEDFFNFLEDVSKNAGGKPVGAKVVISDESNIESLIIELAKRSTENQGIDFFTIDGGDGGTGAAPIALGVLFGKKIYEALEIVISTLKKHKVRDRVKVFASSKLYAPHMSAKALALGADAIGNARSIMIAGGCIRAGVCSGEHGTCPVGMATMSKYQRKSYARAWSQKVQNMSNYIKAHHKGLVQVAAVAGVKSPSELTPWHIMKYRDARRAKLPIISS